MTGASKEDERGLNRRIDSLRRERDSVRRLLEQASMDGVRESVKRLNKRLDRLDSELSGENGN
tara:strand:+ start:529 stop:717 length:189 start_codon:yes stop_codon:yes gene_type:complete